jgi:hypothetical protein
MTYPLNDAFFSAQQYREAVEDLTPAQINKLSVNDYARLTGRPTPAEAALKAIYGEPAPVPPGEPEGNPPPPEEPPDIDVNSPEYFHAWRSQRASNGEGKGIFDSVASQSEAYRSAARNQAGRTGWATSNVAEPPRLTGRQERQEVPPARTVAERFGNPSNQFSL